MAECTNCGHDNGQRKRCPFCDRMVCRFCYPDPNRFCMHGNVPTISIEEIDSNDRIVKIF